MLKLNKIKFITTLLGLLLLSQVTASPNPPSGNEGIKGPAIIGTLTLDGEKLTFNGHCKGDTFFATVDLQVIIASITSGSDLEDTSLPGVGGLLPLGCAPSDSTGKLIINTVTKFTNTGTVVVADVVVLFVVPR